VTLGMPVAIGNQKRRKELGERLALSFHHESSQLSYVSTHAKIDLWSGRSVMFDWHSTPRGAQWKWTALPCACLQPSPMHVSCSIHHVCQWLCALALLCVVPNAHRTASNPF